MARFASENGVHFNPRIAKDFAAPKELRQVEFALNESLPTTPDYWLSLNSQMMKDLSGGCQGSCRLW
jgi:hypothetical protein